MKGGHMKLKIEYGNRVICLPAKVEEHLAGVTENELRVLICILSRVASNQEADTAEIARVLDIDESSVKSAIGFWKGAGVLSEEENTESASRVSVKTQEGEKGAKVTTVTSNDTPHYTGEEIERLFSADSQLRSFIDECQQILGRMFTPLEINKLLALREYYGLDCEYIILLCGYCRKVSKNTVPYLEKLAKSFIDEGITTVNALEEKLAFLERYNTTEGLVRRICGITARRLSAKEKRFVEKWTELGLSEAMIELAYEVTVNNTGNASLPYMNKVLMNWTDAGYITAEDVFAGMEAYRRKKEQNAQSGSSFDTDEFFEAALKRSLNKHGASSD